MSVEALARGLMALQVSEEYARTPGYYAVTAPNNGRRSWEYQHEGDFWRDLIPDDISVRTPKICCGDSVNLRMFRISSWLPRVPGLFWKEESRRIRGASENEFLRRAYHIDGPATFRPSGYWNDSSNLLSNVFAESSVDFNRNDVEPVIFNPLGKSYQVLGGVGNLRLLPSSSDALLCATSSGTYWRGIPVLVRGDAFENLSNIPAHRYVDISGVWASMPREYAGLLGGDNGIPRGCILVEERNSIVRKIPKLISDRFWGDSAAWTLFEYRDDSGLIRNAYSYVIFQAGYGGGLSYLDQRTDYDPDSAGDSAGAASWLRSYVDFYKGSILTEYDQYLPSLGVMLPLNEMHSGVNIRTLKSFIERVIKRALSPETVNYDAVAPFLMNYLNLQDLKILVYRYLGINIELIISPGAIKSQAIEAILQYCEENSLMEKLVFGIYDGGWGDKIRELVNQGRYPGF